MKKRLDDLEKHFPESDPIAELVKIYEAFAHAYYHLNNIELAMQIRAKADPILKANPQLQNFNGFRDFTLKQRITMGKAFYIDYERFIAFPQTKSMKV